MMRDDIHDALSRDDSDHASELLMILRHSWRPIQRLKIKRFRSPVGARRRMEGRRLSMNLSARATFANHNRQRREQKMKATAGTRNGKKRNHSRTARAKGQHAPT